MRGYLLKLSLFQAVMFSRVNYSLFIYELVHYSLLGLFIYLLFFVDVRPRLPWYSAGKETK